MVGRRASIHWRWTDPRGAERGVSSSASSLSSTIVEEAAPVLRGGGEVGVLELLWRVVQPPEGAARTRQLVVDAFEGPRVCGGLGVAGRVGCRGGARGAEQWCKC